MAQGNRVAMQIAGRQCGGDVEAGHIDLETTRSLTPASAVIMPMGLREVTSVTCG